MMDRQSWLGPHPLPMNANIPRNNVYAMGGKEDHGIETAKKASLQTGFGINKAG